jgi:hypothetical protein
MNRAGYLKPSDPEDLRNRVDGREEIEILGVGPGRCGQLVKRAIELEIKIVESWGETPSDIDFGFSKPASGQFGKILDPLRRTE